MELKKLFEQTFPDYYNVNSKKETHVYLSTVKHVLSNTVDRVEKLRIENITDGNIEIAEGIELAKREMSCMTVEILSKQLQK